MDLYEILLLQFTKYNYSVPKNTKGVDKYILLKFIASRQSTQRGALGYSAGGWNKFIRKVFPDKPKGRNYYDWLLNRDALKFCPKCEKVKNLTSFWKNTNISAKYNSYCTDCMSPLNKRAHRVIQARYRANKLKATPSWADLNKIKQIYAKCPDGFQVDHIIPLQGKYVCGLHVENNLQYLTKEDNIKKSNSHESDNY